MSEDSFQNEVSSPPETGTLFAGPLLYLKDGARHHQTRIATADRANTIIID